MFISSVAHINAYQLNWKKTPHRPINFAVLGPARDLSKPRGFPATLYLNPAGFLYCIDANPRLPRTPTPVSSEFWWNNVDDFVSLSNIILTKPFVAYESYDHIRSIDPLFYCLAHTMNSTQVVIS